MAPAHARSAAVTPEARTDAGAAFNPMSPPDGDNFSDSGSDDDNEKTASGDEHEQKAALNAKYGKTAPPAPNDLADVAAGCKLQ